MCTRPTVLASLAALVALGCTYDYDRIRNPDAFVDRALPRIDAVAEVVPPDTPAPDNAPPDVPVTDVFDAPPVMDVQPDLSVMDVQPDIPTRPPRTGTCDLPGVTELAPGATTSVGSSLVVTGSTLAARDPLARMTMVRPLTVVATDCRSVADIASATRVFRYVVRAGPRVVATTNTGACSYLGASSVGYDTLLYALPSCDTAGRRAPYACSDDDALNLCQSCATTRPGCNGLLSTVEVANQGPGDVIYFVVDGFNGAVGNFTFALAENGLRPTMPPTGALPAGTTRAERCACPTSATATTTQTVPFPGGGAADLPVLFDRAGQSVSGTRVVTLRNITGVSGTLRFRRVMFTLAGDCATSVPRMTFDLFVSGALMASFEVTPETPAGVPVAVLYTAASAISRPTSGNTPIELRLRAITPNERCIQAELDVNPATGTPHSALTLVGGV